LHGTVRPKTPSSPSPSLDRSAGASEPATPVAACKGGRPRYTQRSHGAVRCTTKPSARLPFLALPRTRRCDGDVSRPNSASVASASTQNLECAGCASVLNSRNCVGLRGLHLTLGQRLKLDLILGRRSRRNPARWAQGAFGFGFYRRSTTGSEFRVSIWRCESDPRSLVPSFVTSFSNQTWACCLGGNRRARRRAWPGR
jgi:hypothetical protein